MDKSLLLKREIKRKAFHFLALLYTLSYALLGRETTLKILIPLLIVEGSIEMSRFWAPGLNERLLKAFGGIHREGETRKISGIFWTLLGSIVTFWFFSKPVAFAAMGFLIFGDTASALAGILWGRHAIFKGKTFEGSAAFFVVSACLGGIFLPLKAALAGALFSAVIEALPLPGNDNFWVPVLSGIFLTRVLPVF